MFSTVAMTENPLYYVEDKMTSNSGRTECPLLWRGTYVDGMVYMEEGMFCFLRFNLSSALCESAGF